MRKLKRKNARSASRRPDGLEQLETRVLLAAAIRSIDGSGNNLAHPEWGTPGQPLVRIPAAAYADGISAPAGAARPSAREISNNIHHHHLIEDIFNDEGMAAFVYAWGQFIDHDMGLTTNASPADPFNVPVPIGDVFFDPDWTGNQVIGLNRSKTAAGTGTSTANPRQQPNAVTAFIDGSMIYGSDSVRAAALRTGHNGLLRTSYNGEQLPYNDTGLEMQQGPGSPSDYFLAGDVRANENSELTSLQVLFVREHNRLAGLIKQKNHNWNDEKIYQQARRLVIGELQQITYNEFLPSFMGTNPIPAYSGYKPNVNPQVANEFSTAAFRFGHSILGDDVQFFDDSSSPTLPDLKLRDTFFAPSQQLDGGTDGLLKYLASVSAQENDQHFVNGIRNFLFGPPTAGGFDLASLDIQRGRDHGLADYNTTRAAYGLPKVTSFSQITSSPQVAQTLEFTYGNVDNIDLFTGAMVEDHVAGTAIGQTFLKIIASQFTRTRDGDRFWYQRDLDNQELKFIKKLTLTEIIKANTSITNLQPNAFQFDVQINGRVWNDTNGNGRFDRREQPLAGRYVYISDEDSIFDWVVTDSEGRYKMNKLQVGNYTLQIDLPDGWQLTTPDPGVLTVTRHIQFNNTNFGERLAPSTNGNASGATGSTASSSLDVVNIDADRIVDGTAFSDTLI